MSFTISLGTNKSRKNNILKDVDEVVSLTGVLREQSSIVDPVIRVETSTDLSQVNYMVINQFHRAYFVNDIICLRNNLWEIHAHCDVLCSAGSGLQNCKGIVRRQENNWNLYLDDGVFKAYSNPKVVQKEFPSGFDLSNASYILAVAGS